MAGQIYKKVNGVFGWYDKETGVKEGETAFVHQDTMKEALVHPVTGKKVESMTEWNAINKAHGLECVGNDLLSKRKRTVKENVTDERIMDAIEKAESIMRDPTKKRDWDNQQIERFEKHNRIFKGNHRYQ